MIVLLGESSQNLVLRSEELDDATAWNKLTTVTITADTAETNAPNGTQTAEKCVPTSANSFVGQSLIPVTQNITYTFPIYLKSATGGNVVTAISIRQNGLSLISENKAITVTTAWQRFEVSTDVGANSQVAVLIGGGSTWSTGEDLYAWGGQLNEGPVATDYVKTTDKRVL